MWSKGCFIFPLFFNFFFIFFDNLATPERFRQNLRDRKTIVSSLDQNITPVCPIPSSRLDKNLSASQLSFDKTYDFDKTNDFDRTHVEECTPMLPELSREPETREQELYPDDELPTPKIERFSNFEENNSENLDLKYNQDSKFENETSRWTDNSETLTRCNSKDYSKDNSKDNSKENSKDAMTRCSTFTSDINLKCTLNKPPMHPTPTPTEIRRVRIDLDLTRVSTSNFTQNR